MYTPFEKTSPEPACTANIRSRTPLTPQSKAMHLPLTMTQPFGLHKPAPDGHNVVGLQYLDDVTSLRKEVHEGHLVTCPLREATVHEHGLRSPHADPQPVYNAMVLRIWPHAMGEVCVSSQPPPRSVGEDGALTGTSARRTRGTGLASESALCRERVYGQVTANIGLICAETAVNAVSTKCSLVPTKVEARSAQFWTPMPVSTV